MNDIRERALSLAHEDETKAGYATPAAVIDRARVYLDFLQGTSDAGIIQAARAVADAVRGEPGS